MKYVVFTSVSEDSKYGVLHFIEPPEANYYEIRTFFIFNTLPINYSVMFVHENEKGKSNQPIIEIKPLSFLNTITYDDLDILQPMTKEQIKAKYEEYCNYDKLYFIDRKNFTSTALTIIEVLPLRKAIKYRY